MTLIRQFSRLDKAISRVSLFYLLDYITPFEVFQIGNLKKKNECIPSLLHSFPEVQQFFEMNFFSDL